MMCLTLGDAIRRRGPVLIDTYEKFTYSRLWAVGLLRSAYLSGVVTFSRCGSVVDIQTGMPTAGGRRHKACTNKRYFLKSKEEPQTLLTTNNKLIKELILKFFSGLKKNFWNISY